MKLVHTALALILLVPALGGCSYLFGSDDKKDKDEDKQIASVKDIKKPTPICPQVAVVRELDTIRDYGGEQVDAKQLVSAARMRHIDGSCEYLKAKDDQPAGIDINYTLDMDVGRGPRLGGNRVSLPFFIAVVDPGEHVIAKNQLTAEVTLPSDEKFTTDTEDLHVFIPLASDKQDSGPSYRVLAGFQLTQAQLDERMK